MPGFIVHIGATILCTHAGYVSEITSNFRVLVGGQPVVTQNDTFLVEGCPYTLPPPHPCMTVTWLVPSLRIKVNGNPAILQDSIGICQSGDLTPQGPPNVVMTQTRVKGGG
jgi:hypothetical protein